MQKRNMYMVNKSDLIIGVWNEKPSGTSITLDYAKSVGKRTIIIKTSRYI